MLLLRQTFRIYQYAPYSYSNGTENTRATAAINDLGYVAAVIRRIISASITHSQTFS